MFGARRRPAFVQTQNTFGIANQKGMTVVQPKKQALWLTTTTIQRLVSPRLPRIKGSILARQKTMPRKPSFATVPRFGAANAPRIAANA